MVNHDNNQHGPDENLRLRNLWEGVEMMAAVLTMTR
jgi:acetylornithine deacetylase/succinyl-diaminopimelate desuccinylase-like protein